MVGLQEVGSKISGCKPTSRHFPFKWAAQIFGIRGRALDVENFLEENIRSENEYMHHDARGKLDMIACQFCKNFPFRIHICCSEGSQLETIKLANSIPMKKNVIEYIREIQHFLDIH